MGRLTSLEDERRTSFGHLTPEDLLEDLLFPLLIFYHFLSFFIRFYQILLIPNFLGSLIEKLAKRTDR